MEVTGFVIVSKLFLQYESADDLLFHPGEKSLSNYTFITLKYRIWPS